MNGNYRFLGLGFSVLLHAATASPAPQAATAASTPTLATPGVAASTNVVSNDPPSGYFLARDGGNQGQIGSTYFQFNCDTLECPSDDPQAACTFIGYNSISFLTSQAGVVHDPPTNADNLCIHNADTGVNEHVWFGQTLPLSNTQGLTYFINVTAVGGNESWRNTAPAIIDISNVSAPTCTRLSNSWWSGPDSQPLYGADGAIAGQPGTVDAGYWYFYGNGENDGNEQLSVYLSRVKPGEAQSQSSYQFYDGTGWSSDPSSAVVVVNGGQQNSISYNPHLGGYLYLYSYINYIEAKFAYHPQGPWSNEVSILDGSGILYNPVALPNYDPTGKTTVMMYSQSGNRHEQQLTTLTWP